MFEGSVWTMLRHFCDVALRLRVQISNVTITTV